MDIVFSPEARATLRAIITFIELKWGKTSADKFKKTVIKVLKTVASQPYMFKASSIDEKVRKGFITKQTSVLYEIHQDYVLILYFWDNRQDPILTDE